MVNAVDLPITDSFVHELRCYSAVDAAANSSNDPPFCSADLANASDFLPDEFFLRWRRHSVADDMDKSNLPSSSQCCIPRCLSQTS